MIGILGGGLTGLTLASRLGNTCEVLEKDSEPGGLCRSLRFDGYTFDPHGSHILFSKDPRAMAFYFDLLGENRVERRRNTKVYYKGRYVKYPFENGLADLPQEDNFACLMGYIEAYLARTSGKAHKPDNFEDWMAYRFGAGITDRYLLPYNRKIWKTEPRDMAIDWVDGRVPEPPLEDVVKSALGIPTEGYTHQLHFWYPREGGVQALIDGLLPRVARVFPGFAVRSIRRRGSQWIVSDGSSERTYDRLVSTLPIPDLVRALEGTPADVARAASHLVHRSLVTVMLGLDTPHLNEFSWVYFPLPEDGWFNRVSFPSNFSDRAAPSGHCSAMAEITCDYGDGVWSGQDGDLVEHVASKLHELGVLNREEIAASRVARTRHAYVVFDRDHRVNLDRAMSYVAGLGIDLVGRFGQFDYINTDQCILRAFDLAGRLGAGPKRP